MNESWLGRMIDGGDFENIKITELGKEFLNFINNDELPDLFDDEIEK